RGGLAGDATHALETELATRRRRRRAHAAVVAPQVAVEVRVEPEPGTERALLLAWGLAVAHDEAGGLAFARHEDDRVAGEARPQPEIVAQRGRSARERDELARPDRPESADELQKEPRREIACAAVHLEACLHLRTSVSGALTARRIGSSRRP